MNPKGIFLEGISGFLSDMINEALGIFDDALGNLVDVALNAENYMKSTIGMNFDGLYKIIYAYSIYLIILKFLKKGFDVYVLWSDGDADMDPFILFTSFIKAIAIAISFEEMYCYITNVSLEFINAVLGSFNNADITLSSKNLIKAAIAGFLNNGIVLLIIALVYLYMYIKLWIDFIKRGLELFILKKGIAIPCVGLMDADGGVFKPYMKKFIQEIFTVFLQIFLFKLSLIFMINGHFLFAIASISYALSTPAFLNEFIMASQGGGVTTKISQTAHIAQMIRSISG